MYVGSDVHDVKEISGGYSLGVPPLPIPNREVKPKRADGTAPQCGRVGRRLFHTAVFQDYSRKTAFFVIWGSWAS